MPIAPVPGAGKIGVAVGLAFFEPFAALALLRDNDCPTDTVLGRVRALLLSEIHGGAYPDVADMDAKLADDPAYAKAGGIDFLSGLLDAAEALGEAILSRHNQTIH